MKVECTEDLVMDDPRKTVAFLKGKVYDMEEKAGLFVSTNEQGSRHYFDNYGVDDYSHWFEEI